MSILSKYFEKSFVVNLDRREDRMKETKEEFDKWGIDDVWRYPAIDGNILDLSQMNYAHKLNKGEIGLIITHKRIIELAKEEGLKSILIMEDDVVFGPEFEHLDDYMKDVPENWDMFYLGANHTYGQRPEHIAGYVHKLNFSVTTHCFAIRDTMYDVILDKLNSKDVPIDLSYAQIHKEHNVYGFLPNIAKQREGFSDIQYKFVNYDRFF